MFKASLKVLACLAPALVYAQEGAITDTFAQDQAPAEQAPAEQPAEIPAEGAMEEGETIGDIFQEVDWAGLEQLVGSGQCQGNSTFRDLLNNSTNPLYIPKEYRQYVDELGLDFTAVERLNSTDDLLAWNVEDLREVWRNYVDFHNALAERLGDQATNDTMQSEQFNFTSLAEPLLFESFWKPEFEQSNLTAILGEVGMHGIAYEAFSFYYLMFGPHGLMNETLMEQPIAAEGEAEAAPLEGEAAAEGETAEEEAAEGEAATVAQEGFLQDTEAPVEGEAAVVEGEAQAPVEGEAQAPAEGEAVAMDANQALLDIDRRIKEFSIEIACAVSQELNAAQQAPAEEAPLEAAPAEAAPVEEAPAEGEAAAVEGEAVAAEAPVEGV